VLSRNIKLQYVARSKISHKIKHYSDTVFLEHKLSILSLPELDQLHHFSSITITPSKLSITSQLQLFCAKNIKLQL